MNGCFRYPTSLESATHYAARCAGSGLFIDENEGLRPSLRLYRPYGLHIPQAEPAEFKTFPKDSASRLGVGLPKSEDRRVKTGKSKIKHSTFNIPKGIPTLR